VAAFKKPPRKTRSFWAQYATASLNTRFIFRYNLGYDKKLVFACDIA
jgi:hypothetical protein